MLSQAVAARTVGTNKEYRELPDRSEPAAASAPSRYTGCTHTQHRNDATTHLEIFDETIFTTARLNNVARGQHYLA
jgi:hypothetical protein